MHSTTCVHCGESCNGTIHDKDHVFCCEGCKQVYLILQESDACDPSMMKTLDGIQPKGKFKSDKWDFLDEPSIANQLISFSDAKQVHILFTVPNIHCSSCIWLLEHMGRINKGIISSAVDFDKKELALVYNPTLVKLSDVAALLNYIGYPLHSVTQIQAIQNLLPTTTIPLSGLVLPASASAIS